MFQITATNTTLQNEPRNSNSVIRRPFQPIESAPAAYRFNFCGCNLQLSSTFENISWIEQNCKIVKKRKIYVDLMLFFREDSGDTSDNRQSVVFVKSFSNAASCDKWKVLSCGLGWKAAKRPHWSQTARFLVLNLALSDCDNKSVGNVKSLKRNMWLWWRLWISQLWLPRKREIVNCATIANCEILNYDDGDCEKHNYGFNGIQEKVCLTNSIERWQKGWPEIR